MSAEIKSETLTPKESAMTSARSLTSGLTRARSKIFVRFVSPVRDMIELPFTSFSVRRVVPSMSTSCKILRAFVMLHLLLS
jgi:hypothetical protein